MKLSRILLLLFWGCLLGGCTKILDKTNPEAVDEADVWNDLDLATAYANRIHAENLPAWSTEYADYSDESDGGGSYMYGQLTENSIDYWPYSEIRGINVLLTEIDKGTLSEANRKWLKGQAFFFRGWQYFELAKRYGGVPLVLTPQQLTDDLYVSRNTTTETMTRILADLDSAISYLPATKVGTTDNNGRVHKGTALALKGRVLLFYASPQFDPNQTAGGRWQAAYEANKTAKESLDAQGFGLFPGFSNLWFTEMNKEVVFVRRYQFVSTNAASWHNWSAATRPLDISQGATGGNRPALEIVNAFPMKDGRAINDPNSTYTYDPDYSWKNRDPRFNQTIVYNGALWQVGVTGFQAGRLQWTFVGGEQNSPTITGFYMRKAVDTTQTSSQAFNSGTDWIELRYAEVLLNLAEAANETDRTSEAYPLLTAIRARAGIDAGGDNLYGLQPGMTKVQMRNAIRLERQLELAFEGKRFWDLRRWRAFESTLNGTRRHGVTVTLKIPKKQWDEDIVGKMTPQQLVEHLQTNYTTYFQHTVKELDTQFDILWKPEYYFFAIPSRHLQLNSNLAQTKGWSGGTFDPLQ
ncbi:RagB/SusD family nutrient uptake outer membrane protein [Pseudoflavitalea sp. X16]|uniref:RagB/SusD family nutrient uptake outer membrane protein n=1 Tax=Paraflavitalea devenefica TaxID=2716334 RepID=UPI00141E0956|nr:RagB/SusD family nutrient uptake outer membrane protein [Paraflavitalea devenefica]NII28399.1 RagB/SusD family nutrient uptake outer membrane protein [Paraflavitalea devenefica]